jgi:hypothetical protein
MATPTTIYISPKQRQELFRRARRRGTSFSEELRSAVDLYLEMPEGADLESLAGLAQEVNRSLDRSIARLDETLALLRKGGQERP